MTDRTLRQKIEALQRNTYSCGTVWVRLEEVLAILDAHTADTWIANCCVCGRIIDTREAHEGGDLFGALVDDGRWACSSLCWDKAPDADQPAHPTPPAIVDVPASDRPGPDAVAEADAVSLNQDQARQVLTVLIAARICAGTWIKPDYMESGMRKLNTAIALVEGNQP